MDPDSAILVHGLEDPDVAANEVAGRHDEPGRALTHQHCPVLRTCFQSHLCDDLLGFSEGLDLFVGGAARDGRFAFFHSLEDVNELFEVVLELRLLSFRQVDLEADGRVVEDVLAVVLQLLLKVVHELVLPGQLLVALEVIQQVPWPQVQPTQGALVPREDRQACSEALVREEFIVVAFDADGRPFEVLLDTHLVARYAESLARTFGGIHPV